MRNQVKHRKAEACDEQCRLTKNIDSAAKRHEEPELQRFN